MKNIDKRIALIVAIIGGPLVTATITMLLVPDMRYALKSYSSLILPAVVLVSVIIYLTVVAVLGRIKGESDDPR